MATAVRSTVGEAGTAARVGAAAASLDRLDIGAFGREGPYSTMKGMRAREISWRGEARYGSEVTRNTHAKSRQAKAAVQVVEDRAR